VAVYGQDLMAADRLRGGPSLTHTVSLYAFLGYCLLVFSSILALRGLVAVFRPTGR
jgi:hypothetical protein